MIVIRGSRPNTKLLNNKSQGMAVTIGNFDGIHLGHQDIYKDLFNIAQDNNLLKVLITFEPRPADYFGKYKKSNNSNPKTDSNSNTSNRLTLLKDKLSILSNIGFDIVWVMNFNQQLANLEPQDFLSRINSVLNIKYLLIGKDFRFGKNRAGDVTYLEEYINNHNKADKFNNIGFKVINDYEISNIKVSSSLIRSILINKIQYNNINIINKYFGRYYGFTGRVVHGQQKGRTLGYPTVNINVKPGQLLLPKGVYAVNITYNNKKYTAMANWGVRPTVASKLELVLEAHIFNFNQDIYNQSIYIEFVNQIRDEKKFDSLDSLKAQLAEDANMVNNFFILSDTKGC